VHDGHKRCMLRPNDLMFVPRDIYHVTCALDTPSVGLVWRFRRVDGSRHAAKLALSRAVLSQSIQGRHTAEDRGRGSSEHEEEHEL